MVTGGRLLVDCLIRNGVDFMTCVPGESFLAILDGIYDAQRASNSAVPRLVTTRHEAAAANMAEAAGKLTGRPAACFVTRGPGAMHASIAVHTAYQDGTPMLLVIGQVARHTRGREAFQEMDYAAVFGSTTKLVVEIQDADRIPEHVARALYLTTVGRPGPVVLVVPEDVLSELSAVEPLLVPVEQSPAASAADASSLAVLFAAAERPFVIVGGPQWDATTGRNLVAFAEANGIPIAAAFRWQDAVDNRSGSYVGYLGPGCSPLLRSRALEADLLVAFGPRLDDPTTHGFELTEPQGRGRKTVVVANDAAEAVSAFIPDVVITSPLCSLARHLADEALDHSAARMSWTRRLREEYERFSMPPAIDDTVDLGQIVRHVRAEVPDEAIVTNGAGNYAVWLQRFFEFREYGTQLAPRNGAMGYGLPAALSAALLRPGASVTAFVGDGSMLMSGSELATAVRENLSVVIIVVNNSMFGTIRMHQEQRYPGRVIATGLNNPDFVLYAESFGVAGWLVRATDEFPAAFAAARAHDGPALIEIRTDPRRLTPDIRLPSGSPVP